MDQIADLFFQIFDLNTQQFKWITNHLGHTMNVHDIHYSQTSALIERVDIARTICLADSVGKNSRIYLWKASCLSCSFSCAGLRVFPVSYY
jgi:hypothetical protein